MLAKRSIALLVLVSLIGLTVGCRGTSQTRRAERLREDSDVARRHFLRGVGLLDEPTLTQEERSARALDAFEQAERTLIGALSEGSDAGDLAKMPANLLLAEVQLAIGEVHASRQREAMSRVHAFVHEMERSLEQAAAIADLSGFFEQLASIPVDEVIRLRRQAQQEREELLARQEQLVAEQAEVKAEIAEKAQEAAQMRLQAQEIRERQKSAAPRPSLEFMQEADEFERLADLADAEASLLQVSSERLQGLREFVETALTVNRYRLDAMDRREAELQASSAESLDVADGFSEMVEPRMAELRDGAGALAGAYETAVTNGRLALESLTKAQKSAAAANRNASAVSGAAREGASGKDTTVAPVLEQMSDQSSQLSATAMKGDVHLAAADVSYSLLAGQSLIAGLTQRISAVTEALGKDTPEALRAIQNMPANVAELEESAASDYDTAAKAFEQCADRMLSRAPVNLQATEWLYQARRGQALIGLYKVSLLQDQPNPEPLKEADAVIRAAIEKNQNRLAQVQPLLRLHHVILSLQ